MRYASLLALTFLTSLPVSCDQVTDTGTKDYEIHEVKKSGTVIDCSGGQFNGGKPTEIQILAGKNGPPKNVQIRDCVLNGSIRVIGMSATGNGEAVRESSRSLGHTQRAQEAAPSQILVENMTITGTGRSPIYLSPGVTFFTLQNSKIQGYTNSVVMYLDAESANNTIEGNTFDVTSQEKDREVIAVDGSAYNKILNNNFKQARYGGIYLYRNCGEAGTVRHQSPQFNTIQGNSFNLNPLGWGEWGVWLGSRNGNRSYCEDDAGYPFGSSIDNRDFADNNTVVDNRFTGSSRTVKNDGSNNLIRN